MTEIIIIIIIIIITISFKNTLERTCDLVINIET